MADQAEVEANEAPAESHEPVAQTELEKMYDVTDPSETPAPTDEKPAGETPEQAAPEKEATGGENIDQELSARAKALGWNDEEIAEVGSNAVLQRIVDRMEAAAKPAAAANEAGKKPETKPEAEAEPEFKIDLDESEFDPKIVDQFQKMNAHYAKHISAMREQFKAELGQANAFAQEQRQQQAQAALDATFRDLSDLKEFVGDKPLSEIGAHSEQGKARVAIVEKAKALAAGYQNTGQKVPDLKTILTQAAQIVLGPKLSNIATQKVRTAVASRQAQFVARPTSIKGSDVKSPVERATEKVSALLKAKGEL